MHTACFYDFGRGGLTTETPIDRDPSHLLPGQRPPWRTRDRNLLLEGTWDQAARQEMTSYTSLVDRQTPVKTLPCPKLRLRVVMMFRTSYHDVIFFIAALTTLTSLTSRRTLDPNCRVPRARGWRALCSTISWTTTTPPSGRDTAVRISDILQTFLVIGFFNNWADANMNALTSSSIGCSLW